MNIKHIFCALFICAALPAFASKDSSLHIGDLAPALQVKFVKGTSITRFQKGKVYVLEFWATWCGPCKKAMPHVSEISRKYSGKAEVIGVSVWERSKPDLTINTQVSNFIKANDSIMDFAVAMENEDGAMAKKWLDPAGVIGIPATMIIDGTGRIVWIGQPWDLETPLTEVLSGKYDMKSYAAKYKEEQDKNIQMMADYHEARPLGDSISKLEKANDYNQAITVYNSALAKNPRLKEYLFGYYIIALAVTAPDNAYDLLSGMKDSNEVQGAAISLAPKTGLQPRFYQFVQKTLTPMDTQPGAWQPLACAGFALGDIEKAILYQQKFVDFLTAATNRGPAGFYESAQKTLADYKAALKK